MVRYETIKMPLFIAVVAVMSRCNSRKSSNVPDPSPAPQGNATSVETTNSPNGGDVYCNGARRESLSGVDTPMRYPNGQWVRQNGSPTGLWIYPNGTMLGSGGTDQLPMQYPNGVKIFTNANEITSWRYPNDTKIRRGSSPGDSLQYPNGQLIQSSNSQKCFYSTGVTMPSCPASIELEIDIANGLKGKTNIDLSPNIKPFKDWRFEWTDTKVVTIFRLDLETGEIRDISARCIP